MRRRCTSSAAGNGKGEEGGEFWARRGDLLALTRSAAAGLALIERPLLRRLRDCFPFEDTPDQARRPATLTIRSGNQMDRLIAETWASQDGGGAARAFVSVADGKQSRYW